MAHPLPAPNVGDRIYIPTSLYLDHGEDDVQGGLATISQVTFNPIQKSHFVTVQGIPGHSYNWQFLAPRQEELQAEFADRIAREDPDYGGDPNQL